MNAENGLPMNTVKQCQDCGTALGADAPQGLCPGCLMRAGFATRDGQILPANEEVGREELSRIFPHLEILELLGRGGMGSVYKARQPSLDRYVALKILPSAAAASPGFAERFNREARALARLNHQNIVGLYDFGQAGEHHYFLMEFVDGANLRQLQKAGRFTPEQALSIIPQICEALQFAHEAGVVHRDIKPENVLLDRKGRVKIADFGLARLVGMEAASQRLTGVRDIVGTPHYMAPEQVEHPQSVDHRADIYSLGVVFYEMLTGELPLGRFSPPSTKVQVDVRLDEVVLHALEKEPGRRYQHASQIKTDVESVAAGSGPANARAQKPAANGKVFPLPGKVRTLLLSAAVTLLVIGMVAFLAGYFNKGRAQNQSLAGQVTGAAPTAPASQELLPPVVISSMPAAGAQNVDPNTAFISVTFSKQMVDGSWSWADAFPDCLPEITGTPFFKPDGCTCVLPVRLKPGRVYALWLNSEKHQNFRDIDGHTAVPYLLVFKTKP